MTKKVVREILEADKPALGAWQMIAQPDITAIIGQAGWDFVMLDMEHNGGQASMETIRGCICEADAVGVPIIVRVPEKGHPFLIEQVLDVGAQGVIVPMVESAAQAEEVVRAVRFPPLGDRGYCPAIRAARYGSDPDWVEKANRQLLAGVIVETPLGVQALPEILEVEGLDVVYIGDADLSLRMGLGRYDRSIADTVVSLSEKITAAGKAPFFWSDFVLQEPVAKPRSGRQIICGAVDIGSLSRQMRAGYEYWNAARQ